MAAAVLGGFNGCTIGALSPESDPWLIIAGALLGVGLGLAVVRSPRLMARPGRSWIGLMFGLAWAASSAACFMVGSNLRDSNRVVSRRPLRLEAVGQTGATFVTKDTARYDVVVELGNGRSFHDVNALIAGWAKLKAREGTSPQPEFLCTVVGTSVEHTAYRAVGNWWNERPGFVIGFFEAKRGQKYELRVNITKPSVELQRMRPMLAVEETFVDWYGPHFVAGTMITMGGFLSCILAAGILGTWTINLLKARRNRT